MARNMTWCLMRNFLKQNNYICMKPLAQVTVKRYEHAYKAPVENEITTNIDYHEAKTYQQYLDENSTGHNNTVRTLMNLLDVRRETAVMLTKKWTIFDNLSKTALLKNYELLRAAGAFKSTIRQNIQALADTPENIKSKISSLKKIKLEINYAISLFQLPALDLAAFANTTLSDRVIVPEYRNRVEYLADKFNCQVSTICTVLSHHPSMLYSNIRKVVNITEFLLEEAGMKPEYILGDLTVYHYAFDNIQDRVYRAQRAGISPMKPWIIRCPLSNIEKWEQKRANWNTLVGPTDTLEKYISKIMNCDVEYASSLLYRDPDIRSICIVKLTNVLKFLANAGYTIHDIYRASKILHRAEERIRFKYQSWVDAGLGQPPICLMNFSEKAFEEKLQQEIAKKSFNPTDS